jgi:hypothetical protein
VLVLSTDVIESAVAEMTSLAPSKLLLVELDGNDPELDSSIEGAAEVVPTAMLIAFKLVLRKRSEVELLEPSS